MATPRVQMHETSENSEGSRKISENMRIQNANPVILLATSPGAEMTQGQRLRSAQTRRRRLRPPAL